jgi:hypothetical protein
LGKTSAQYVFKLAKAPNSAAAMKNAVTIGSARPPVETEQLLHSKPQPKISDEAGKRKKKQNMPLFSLS